MSHLANIRNWKAADHSETPVKRRKLTNGVSNHTSPLTNGIHSHKFSASPSHNAKPTSIPQPVESDAKITQEDELEAEEEPDGSIGDVDESDLEQEEIDSDNEYYDAHPPSSNSLTNGNVEQTSVPQEQEIEPPTFGDLLLARSGKTVNINEALPQPETQPKSSLKKVAPPPATPSLTTAASLGTVLTQALKTNDVDLLESCFQVTNLDSIRATIERLNSVYATSLLSKLTERLHKRPGRAGSLMIWVQWAIVAHGGYLASQPNTMRELHALYQVVKQRANGLTPLLALKGKLDMLEAQMQLRQSMKARSRRYEGQEEDVYYIEGAESASDEDKSAAKTNVVEDAPEDEVAFKGRKRVKFEINGRTLNTDAEVSDDEVDAAEEDDIDDVEDGDGFTPGTTLPTSIDMDSYYSEDSEVDDEDDEVSGSEEFIDDEADETDESADFSDEVDYDDVDQKLESDGEENTSSSKKSKGWRS